MVTSSYIVVPDEIDALREAVEVLENIPQPTRAELAYYKGAMERAREDASHWLNRFIDKGNEATDVRLAALEAVEVLEDMYAQRDAETERWFAKWQDEYSAHHADKRALKDAEAKVADLHNELAAKTEAVDILLAAKDRWMHRANDAEAAVQRMRGFLGGTLATAIRRITRLGGTVFFSGDNAFGLDSVLIEVTNPRARRYRNIVAGYQLDTAFEPDRILGDAVNKAATILDRS